MKALCLVAHPDDCVIFAYSYIYNHPEMSWTICYLTYTEQAEREIKSIIEPYDLVLTHDEHGDYGHLHHVFVHACAKDHPGLVTFAKPGQGTEYTVPLNAYTLDEFPQHRDVVAGFHSTEHKNSYKEAI